MQGKGTPSCGGSDFFASCLLLLCGKVPIAAGIDGAGLHAKAALHQGLLTILNQEGGDPAPPHCNHRMSLQVTITITSFNRLQITKWPHKGGARNGAKLGSMGIIHHARLINILIQGPSKGAPVRSQPRLLGQKCECMHGDPRPISECPNLSLTALFVQT